jgi:urease accessory protein
MDRDAKKMRGERPFVFTCVRGGQGVEAVAQFVIRQGMLGE